jgi:hypothetical protein
MNQKQSRALEDKKELIVHMTVINKKKRNDNINRG